MRIEPADVNLRRADAEPSSARCRRRGWRGHALTRDQPTRFGDADMQRGVHDAAFAEAQHQEYVVLVGRRSRARRTTDSRRTRCRPHGSKFRSAAPRRRHRLRRQAPPGLHVARSRARRGHKPRHGCRTRIYRPSGISAARTLSGPGQRASFTSEITWNLSLMSAGARVPREHGRIADDDWPADRIDRRIERSLQPDFRTDPGWIAGRNRDARQADLAWPNRPH